MQVNKTQTRAAVRAKRREKIGKEKRLSRAALNRTLPTCLCEPSPEAKAVDLARSADLSDEQGVLKF